MKGVVFTEFLEFVEAKLGADMVDDIIDDTAPDSGGAYTAVGTYPYSQMGALVGALANRTGMGVHDLLSLFGNHLCKRFVVKFPQFFEAESCLFDFLATIDNHIHVEVRKLYPDAELPVFRLTSRDAHSVDLDYESCRPLASLAEGMLAAAAEHYGESIAIEKARIEAHDRSYIRFSIRHAGSRLAA